MGEIVGVTKELLDQRPVETEFLADLLDRFLGRAGPAKYAAGSPGSARVNRNVTITTPIRLGIANINRLPIMVSMSRASPFQRCASCFSLPPCGGGAGWGVSADGGCSLLPPSLSLPRKGGNVTERPATIAALESACDNEPNNTADYPFTSAR